MTSPGGARHSMDTILTFDNRDTSQWSMVWSTAHVTEVDNTMSRRTLMQKRGRRRLRIGSLAVSALMTMHCRIPASALTGGTVFFMVVLVAAVVCLANPARHFEVYLGQWSISGPGRAFRIIPMLDGIGIAMCINAIVRAITCCTIAAIAALYVVHSLADAKLPFTYCRNFNLESYTPKMVDLQIRGSRRSVEKKVIGNQSVSVGLKHQAWRNVSYTRSNFHISSKIGVCNETYAGTYPPLYTTPAYNFFYVEMVQFRNLKNSLGQFNVPLGLTIVVTWLILWSFMVMEKLKYSRIIWNNIKPWIIVVPWIWTILLLAQAASNLTLSQTLRTDFQVRGKDIVPVMADALEIAVYIHSLSVGSELIHGKALNNYAFGHIDPNLSGENVWHSGIVLLLAGLHSGGAAMCALVDYKHFNASSSDKMKESTLWIMPMYSKCTSMGGYSHLVTTLVFGGLMFSYLTVAFVLLKTALHTIFEYSIKLVFVEQFVVAGLILSCMGLSLFYATNGGIPLLESVNAIMTGVAMLFVLFLELVCLLCVYRGHDFQSDMHLATEDNTCASRIGMQWQIIPFITLAGICMKLLVLPNAELPSKSMGLAAIPLVAVILALPLRAAHNAYTFLRQPPRRTG